MRGGRYDVQELRRRLRDQPSRYLPVVYLVTRSWRPQPARRTGFSILCLSLSGEHPTPFSWAVPRLSQWLIVPCAHFFSQPGHSISGAASTGPASASTSAIGRCGIGSAESGSESLREDFLNRKSHREKLAREILPHVGHRIRRQCHPEPFPPDGFT